MTLQHVRTSYGALADRYIELFGSTKATPDDSLDLITRHLRMESGTVLDVGCGPGHLTEHLRSRGADAMGVDIVPEFIAHASDTYPAGRYLLGSMSRLAFTDGSIAGVLSWFSLIHLPPDDLDEVLLEFRRVLAADGVLVVGFFEGDEVAPFEHKVTTAYFWPADELSARLQRAGFTEIERALRPGDPERPPRPSGVIAAVAG